MLPRLTSSRRKSVSTGQVETLSVMKKLILIDGNAILHRAYHALPPLTNKEGVIVNAVYGFFSMLLKIIQDLKPEYLAVCFDKEAPTFRKQLYVGYQAQRPKTADDLVPQIGIVHDVLQKAKVAIFEIDGYEADDLIGTLARQAVELDGRRWKIEDGNLKMEDRRSINPQSSTLKNPPSVFYHPSSNIEVIIVSGDRDMLQLVNSHVKVLAPIKGITEMILFDSKKVEEKYGIEPSQFIDYKSLVGDSSDNYPGVTGIGPKTASSLLNEYGSFDEMYKKINSLPPKTAEKLATDAEQAALAKKLATIVTDAPIKLDFNDCAMAKFSMEGARSAFEGLGFKSLVKRLQAKVEDKPEKKEKNNNQQLGLL